MSQQQRWFVFKRGKPVAGPFRDVYAAYRKAQQVHGELVKAVSITAPRANR